MRIATVNFDCKTEPRKEKENINNKIKSAIGSFTDIRKLMFILLISWAQGLVKDSILRLRVNPK